MTKYRTRQREVEARHLGDDANENHAIMRWCGGAAVQSVVEGLMFHVPAQKRASVVAHVGDWIIKHGEFFRVRSDANFHEEYEVVPENKSPKPADVKGTAPAATATTVVTGGG